MAGSERPVLKDMQNPSSESSLHMKVDESPQSSVSEERKITSEPYKCNGSRQRESKKEESKQKWSRTSYSEEEDKEPLQIVTLQAGFPKLNENLIEKRRRAPPTFNTRSTTPLQKESNFIQTEFHICKCGYPASNLTSWTKQNPGRRFQACQFYEQDTDSRGCDYFKWVDLEMTEWQKDVTNSLMADVNAQKLELRMMKKVLDDVKAEKRGLALENEALKKEVKFMKKHGLMLPAFCCGLVFVVVVVLLFK